MSDTFLFLTKKCHALGNFNALMAIVAGLNNFSVQRLRKPWEMLAVKTREIFQKLERVMAPQKNFELYRRELEKRTPPLIPYMGMYLRDITYVYDGNSDYLDEEKTLINLEKLTLASAILSDIQKFQSVPYDIPVDDALRAYLLNVKYLDEEALHTRSLECEPPEQSESTRTSLFGLSGQLVKHPSSWTVNDVQEWLEAKGMADYREKFLSKQIDGPQLMELDNKTLLTLGVDHLVQRKKLLTEIIALHTVEVHAEEMRTEGNCQEQDSWKSKDPTLWSPEEVSQWLESFGMGEYKIYFLEGQITGKDLLDFENGDLLALKVARLGHRKRLLKAIAELAPQKDASHPTKTPPQATKKNEDKDQAANSFERRSWTGEDFADVCMEEFVSDELKSRDDSHFLIKPLCRGADPLAQVVEDVQERLLSFKHPASKLLGPNTSVTIRCNYESDFLTFTAPPNSTVRELRQTVAQLCGFDKKDSFTMKYKDLEDDYITIRTEEDLKFALSLGMMPGTIELSIQRHTQKDNCSYILSKQL